MPEGAEQLRGGLSRERLVAAALDLLQQDGLDGLSMRALAERLQVKAASLYWHVRDRAELLELLAASLVNEVHLPAPSGDWRADALGVCAAVESLAARRRDAARLLLVEVPRAIERGPAHAALSNILAEAGPPIGEANETAAMMLGAVLLRSLAPAEGPLAPQPGRPLVLAIDSGSRGVTLRAGPTSMSELIRAPQDPRSSAPAIVRGDRVIVRRLRGGGRGELELNPAHAWRFHVQSGTWNTLLDLTGLDVRGIHIDSGAARLECLLPPPRTLVPIDVSSGVIRLRFRRPPGVPVVAEVHTGSLQLRLDDVPIAASTRDTRWESRPGAAAEDHYQLTVHSGTVRVSLEEDASISADSPAPAPPVPRPGVAAALEIVLDGVAARSRQGLR